jgi:hypothetical protein
MHASGLHAGDRCVRRAYDRLSMCSPLLRSVVNLMPRPSSGDVTAIRTLKYCSVCCAIVGDIAPNKDYFLCVQPALMGVYGTYQCRSEPYLSNSRLCPGPIHVWQRIDCVLPGAWMPAGGCQCSPNTHSKSMFTRRFLNAEPRDKSRGSRHIVRMKIDRERVAYRTPAKYSRSLSFNR